MLERVAIETRQNKIARSIRTETLRWSLPEVTVFVVISGGEKKLLVQLIGRQRDQVIDVETRFRVAVGSEPEHADLSEPLD